MGRDAGGDVVKALSLIQPWASLIAFGEKRIETRSWATSYRGIVAIHASKRIPPEDREFVECDEDFQTALSRNGVTLKDLPLGCIIATAVLDRCIPTIQARAYLEEVPGNWPEHERHFGNFDRGRFAWLLTDVRPLRNPIPAKGSLGLWEWDEAGLEP